MSQLYNYLIYCSGKTYSTPLTNADDQGMSYALLHLSAFLDHFKTAGSASYRVRGWRVEEAPAALLIASLGVFAPEYFP